MATNGLDINCVECDRFQISDAALRERWEATRIDVTDGTLYTTRMFGQVGHHPGRPGGLCTRHADFPALDEVTRNRLITRTEELPENLDRHFQFYNANVLPQVRQFAANHDPSKVVRIDGEQSSSAMLNVSFTSFRLEKRLLV